MCPQSESSIAVKPVNIRPYRPSDSEALDQICRRSPEAAQWTKASYEQAHLSGQIVLIAETDARVCGFLIARIAGDEAEILNTAVDPAYRRKGAATLLVKEAVSEAQAHRVKSIYLEVRTSNAAAIAFYGKHGFVKTAERHAYYNRPTENALVMKKVTG